MLKYNDVCNDVIITKAHWWETVKDMLKYPENATITKHSPPEAPKEGEMRNE